MKKDININGTVFFMTEKAHKKISEYLASLRSYFREDVDGQEIIADIEARVSEKLAHRRKKKEVIAEDEILNVLADIGQIEDFLVRENNSEYPLETQKNISTNDTKAANFRTFSINARNRAGNFFTMLLEMGRKIIEFSRKQTQKNTFRISHFLRCAVGLIGVIASVLFASLFVALSVALFFRVDIAYFEPPLREIFPPDTYLPSLLALFTVFFLAILFLLNFSWFLLYRSTILNRRTFGILGFVWILGFGTCIGLSAVVVPYVLQQHDERVIAYENAKVKRVISLETFTDIMVSNGYQVDVRKGADYQVTFYGAEDILDRVGWHQNENVLAIEAVRPKEFHQEPFRFELFEYQAHPEIVVTTPTLENIAILDNAAVNISGFTAQDITIAIENGWLDFSGDLNNATVTMEEGYLRFTGNIQNLIATATQQSTLYIDGNMQKAEIETTQASSANCQGTIENLTVKIRDDSAVGLQGRGENMKISMSNNAYLYAEKFVTQLAQVEVTDNSNAIIFSEILRESFADKTSMIKNTRTQEVF